MTRRTDTESIQFMGIFSLEKDKGLESRTRTQKYLELIT